MTATPTISAHTAHHSRRAAAPEPRRRSWRASSRIATNSANPFLGSSRRRAHPPGNARGAKAGPIVVRSELKDEIRREDVGVAVIRRDARVGVAVEGGRVERAIEADLGTDVDLGREPVLPTE